MRSLYLLIAWGEIADDEMVGVYGERVERELI